MVAQRLVVVHNISNVEDKRASLRSSAKKMVINKTTQQNGSVDCDSDDHDVRTDTRAPRTTISTRRPTKVVNPATKKIRGKRYKSRKHSVSDTTGQKVIGNNKISVEDINCWSDSVHRSHHGHDHDEEDESDEATTELNYDTCSQTVDNEEEEGEKEGEEEELDEDEDEDEDYGITNRTQNDEIDKDDDDDDDNGTVALAVFFEGTTNTVTNPICTQLGIFYECCRAVPVSFPEEVFKGEVTEEKQRWCYKMAFDGCGVTNGAPGVLFGTGLREQCKAVVPVVSALSRRHRGRPIKVVALGLSRGGVACLELARTLSEATEFGHFDDDVCEVTLSACLFDPVPGNALSTGFPWTGTRSMDLRRVQGRCLRRVLALYTCEPLPDWTLHAPCLSRYHPETLVEEDVMLGCHQGALFAPTPYPINEYDVASNLAFRRLSDFFLEEGVPMSYDDDDDDNDDDKINHDEKEKICKWSSRDTFCDGSSSSLSRGRKRRKSVYQPTLEHCVELCREALKERRSNVGVDDDNDDDQCPFVVRRAHDRTGKNRVIVRRISREGKAGDEDCPNNLSCLYLNRHHEQLELALLRSKLRQHQEVGTKGEQPHTALLNFSPPLVDDKQYTYQLDLQPRHQIFTLSKHETITASTNTNTDISNSTCPCSCVARVGTRMCRPFTIPFCNTV